MRLLAALFLLSSIACGVHGRRATTGHGSIVGTVVEPRSSEPIIYCRVHLLDADFDARTDEEGHYVISNVPVCRYTLVVQCSGYPADTIRRVRVREGKATTVDIVVQDFTLLR
ncbi:MAG: carboxypeptidase regulatory-like domain-containing protein [Flavobacteriales bacterium]|nr:carboxypeptidase regulatory-like domain-containing protein [Flavobacteriales bacterium]